MMSEERGFGLGDAEREDEEIMEVAIMMSWCACANLRTVFSALGPGHVARLSALCSVRDLTVRAHLATGWLASGWVCTRHLSVGYFCAGRFSCSS